MKSVQKKRTLVVCHDAGAGQLISAYVKKHARARRFLCVVSGPAQTIFKRKGLSRFLIAKARGLKLLEAGSIEMLLAGTSWISRLEREMVRKAKQRGIATAVYLDHWTNYRERFGYPQKGWRNNLPDELWVGDAYALKRARQYFKNRTLKFVPNAYFSEIKRECRALKRRVRAQGNAILFMSEPTMLAHKTFYESGYVFNETEVLTRVLEYLAKKQVHDPIVICYHPAEAKGKYRALLARYADTLRFRKADRNLLNDFAHAKLVIGRRSMALVLAALCGKKTVSFIPDGKVAFPLPFKEIIKIRDINRLKV